MAYLNRVAALGVALTGAIALAGCSNSSSSSSTAGSPTGAPSTTASAGTGQIAFVTNNTSDYWLSAKAGFEKAKAELNIPDSDATFIMPADGTAATQKQLVNDAIAKGVNAIAISPVDPSNETTWINSIASKASVITQDSDAPKSSRLCYLGTDNHSAGLTAGGLIKLALPNGGKIMVFVGNKDAQNAHDRYQGIVDALKGTKVQILDVRTDQADNALAKTNAADALAANPDLAAEVGLWGYNGPAILSAVQAANKVGKVKIICFDGEDATLAGVKSGAIFGTVVQQPFEFGYEGTKLLWALSKGDKSGVPASGTKFFPALAVTPSNIAKYEADQIKLTGKP
jgi:ribose transport system substrate-binding protein